ncbi:MAG: dTMP kinase [Candidatus Thermoplasmatota archaeon]
MTDFIVLEGIDGSGKSSVGEFMSEKFDKVYLTREPSDSEPGELAQKIARDDTSPFMDLFLYLADRAQHTEKIREKLDEGFDVICDRYWGSTAAYQSAHEEIDLGYSLEIQKPFILKPSMTFLLDIDPEISLGRISDREEKSKYERLNFLKDVRNNYLKIAEEHDWIIIDANQDLKDVKKSIEEKLGERN